MGQYTTGTVINGTTFNSSDALMNTGMGALGGRAGGAAKLPTDWGGSKWGNLMKEAYTDVFKAQNLNSKAIGQSAGGALVGNTTEIPCFTCAPKCE